MTNSQPLISILICNYNYAAYIQESLESASRQTYPNIEIIVIDDGSSDNSVQLVRQYIHDHPQENIHLKAKRKNQGICYARNEALGLASGKYLLFLDSDDTLPENYVGELHKAARKEKADVVYCDIKSFGDEESTTHFPEYSQKELLLHNYIHISALVRKSSLKDHQFDIKLNRKALEDYDFWLGLSLAGLKFVKATGTYLNYRLQKDSRNRNAAAWGVRAISSVVTWKYSINKYRRAYPQKVENTTKLFTKASLRKLGLSKLSA